MIATQLPLNPLANMSAFHNRPTHARHPSAPVVVRPTQTPGLLSLSKPVPRLQQQHAHPRAPRSSPRSNKPQRSQQQQQAKPLAQPADDAKHSAPTRSEADKVSSTPATPATQEKSARGRQPKPAAPDHQTADHRRSMSLSSRAQARRPSHQPSPVRIPQQADHSESARPHHPHVNPLRAQPSTERPSDSNLFDPFLVQPSQDNNTNTTPEPSPAKVASKKASASA
ncbi:hypothetical protein EIP91_011331, partial [Steccherinum ochraceum]